MEKTYQLMFLNNGGLILNLGDGDKTIFVHTYDDMVNAVTDLKEFFKDDGYPVENWDGNEIENYGGDFSNIEYDMDTERNGGAFWGTVEQALEKAENASWGNIRAFYEAWTGEEIDG